MCRAPSVPPSRNDQSDGDPNIGGVQELPKGSDALPACRGEQQFAMRPIRW